jgi:hypothetical protein
MTRPARLAACAALVLLAACGGSEAEDVGDNMVDAQAAVADTLDKQADILENQAEKFEDRAEEIREQADMTRDWSTDKQEVMRDAVANGVAVDENVMNSM